MKNAPDDAAGRLRLLIVDDEPELLAILQEFLGEEFELEAAATGTEALESLARGTFAVVLTDINLPGADGIAVLRAAKAADPETEVILLTGNASTMTSIEALRDGAYDYLVKPFDLLELDQSLRRALEGRRLREENRRFVAQLQAANEDLHASEEALRRHRDQLKGMVEESTRRVRTLHELGQEITSSLNLDRTLGLVLEKSLELTGATEGLLFLADEPGGPLACREARGPARDAKASADLAASLGPLNERLRIGHAPAGAKVALPDGESREAYAVPLLQEGEVRGIVVILTPGGIALSGDDRDLLGGLAAQAAIAVHNATVFTRMRDLERMKSEFVAVVSHELRTPLTAIKGTLELLADPRYFPVESRQGELFSICQANTDRLEALVNDILDLSKLESSRLSSHLVETSLATLVRGAVLNLGNLAGRKGLRIITEIADDLPVIRADEMRIVQVLSNLFSNAMKFSSAGMEITVAVVPDSGGARVEIRDRGIGIAPEDLPKLFSRFHQLNASSTRTAGGTGLGLVISKGIVEEHGGWIRAESNLGEGSVFSFWLPGKTAAAKAAEAEMDAAGPPASPEPERRESATRT
jgi:signal transduction histidine kinase/DNA-binding response OmpR family regulator